MRRFMPKLMVSVLTISFSPSASGAISSTTFLGESSVEHGVSMKNMFHKQT